MKIGNYQTHEFADLFPMIGDEELNELVDSIAECGISCPITLFEGKILDGRNRMRAAIEAGIELDEERDFEDFTGSREDALDFVGCRNVMRRHLTASQRAMVLARMLEAKRNGEVTTFDVQEAAKANKSTVKMLFNARRVLNSGDDNLVDLVDRGEVRLDAAVEKIRADEPDKPQREEWRTGAPSGNRRRHNFMQGIRKVLKGVSYENEIAHHIEDCDLDEIEAMLKTVEAIKRKAARRHLRAVAQG